MTVRTMLGRFGMSNPWASEVGAAALGLLIGVAVIPVCIFYGGLSLLGRYEGASLGRIYSTVFSGLGQASVASWVVLLGPYALYLLFKALRAWWRAGTV